MDRVSAHFIAAALAVAAAPLAAAEPDGPVPLDRASANGCTLTLAAAGKAMLVRATGLIPGESYHLTLTNGDMQPVDFSAFASGAGSFAEYYLPFRFNRDGGVVQIRVDAANCTLVVAAPWTRGVPVND